MLGTDPNMRCLCYPRMSTLLSVCVGPGTCSRTPLIAMLIDCDADPRLDRIWIEAGSLTSRDIRGPPGSVIRHQLETEARQALAELCRQPRPLQTLCAHVVRKCLAAAEVNGVVKNTDRLPLPPAAKSMIKLERYAV